MAGTPSAAHHPRGGFGLFERLRGDIRSYLPRGRSLPDSVWQRRHQLVVGLLFAHAAAIFLYASLAGFGLAHALLQGGAVVAIAAAACLPLPSRILRSSIGAAGLVTCSAILVHLSSGLVEMHFHFFVALAIITMYQEWLPFLVSVFYIVLHHGIVGAIEPTSVFNHPEALGHPWRWALIHGLFVAAACLAYALQWRFNEDLRDHAELLLDAAGEGILGLDPAGRIVFANPVAGRMLGARPQQLAGRPVASFLQGLGRSGGHARAFGQRVEEVTAATTDGRTFPAECTVTPVVRRGTVQGQVVAFKDVSERKRAEEERLRAEQEQVARLKALDDMKTQFLNTAAHELRTPLMPLGLQVEILQLKAQQKNASPEERMALDVLGRNFDRLKHLVEDILGVAQIEAGRMTLNPTALDLGAALREAREAFQPLAERNGVALDVEEPQGLAIRADPLRFNQILFNLLSNGLRHTPPGGLVTVRCETDGGEAVLAVSDTGAGLTPPQIAQLFQPFGQVQDGVAAQRVGTGLGLFITKSLVELHGGRVAVRSDGPGKGATFSFTIPLMAAAPLVRIGDRPAAQAPSLKART